MYSKKLISIFKKLESKISYLDIGAREDLLEPWRSLEPYLSVVGFEPDPIEIKRLKKLYPQRKYFDTALFSSESEQTLFETIIGSQSSIYPMNDSIKQFETQHWEGRLVKDRHKLNTRDLDQYTDSISPDIIKIDTQGSEYAILTGAKNMLKSHSPLLFLETWCHEVYKGAPLMHEIIDLLYSEGYELWEVSTAAAWRYEHPVTQNTKFKQRLIGLNLLMIPNEKKLLDLPSSKRIKYSLVFALYGYYDIALLLLKNTNDELYADLESFIKNEKKITTRLKYKILALFGIKKFPPLT